MSDLYRDYLDFDQGTSEQDDPNDDHDTLVVNHVKGLLNEVMEAVANNDKSVETVSETVTDGGDNDIIVPTVIMVYEDVDGNASSPTSSTTTTTHSTSSFKNNTHIILVENGNVTVLLLNKLQPDNAETPSDHKMGNKKVQNMQTISSTSFYDGNFKNISFAQVGNNPSGMEKNGSNQQMSSSSSNVLHFQNSSNNVVTDQDGENGIEVTITDIVIEDDGNVNKANQIANMLGEHGIEVNVTDIVIEDGGDVNKANQTGNSTTTSTTTTTTTTSTTTSLSTTMTTTSTTSTTLKTSTTRSTTKKTTVRTTPSPPPTTTTPPPSLLQAVAQQVGVAMATISGIASFNPLYLLLGKRRRSFGENISNREVGRQYHISHIVQSEKVKL